MSFDLSRIRFDARRDFLGVIMQQGRVQLDADWNEWVAQLGRRLQAGTLDTFGGSVVPRTTPDGFLIQATGGGFTIGRGRIYVDGLLAENHGDGDAGWDDRLAEPTGSTAVDYAAQPYYPDPPALPAEGRHLVYVDVWQRDLTAVQAPDLIEQAVGVDTTGRRQTVWQVKLLPDIGNAGCSSADEDVPGWAAITAPSPARLSTTTGTPDFTPTPARCRPRRAISDWRTSSIVSKCIPVAHSARRPQVVARQRHRGLARHPHQRRTHSHHRGERRPRRCAALQRWRLGGDHRRLARAEEPAGRNAAPARAGWRG